MPTLVDVGVWLLVVLTAGVTFFAVFLVWRNGYVKGWRRAKSEPPKCLQCGYNLSGLTHCRCPECGKEYRLEELWNVPSHLYSADENISKSDNEHNQS